MDEILKQLKIKADVIRTEKSKNVEKFFLKLHPSTRVDKIEKYATEIALGMKSYGKPIIKPITEQGLVSVELLISAQENVIFDSLLSDLNKSTHELPIIIGRTLFGANLILDLTKLPHLLIAGSTGSGKSVLLHSIISSLILNKNEVDLILIDPKMVELSCYGGIKNLVSPIIIEPESALKVIEGLIEEMNDRYRLLARKKVNNITEYNKKTNRKMSYLVLVIDEFADLIYSVKKEFEKALSILSQKARASGIHIILATQRPSVDVVSGNIKANFPARICFKVPSFIDSRVILDIGGAEKLMGAGDGLIVSTQHDLVRFKGAYISLQEIEKIVKENKLNTLDKLFRKFI